jgi:hypothetical protein
MSWMDEEPPISLVKTLSYLVPENYIFTCICLCFPLWFVVVAIDYIIIPISFIIMCIIEVFKELGNLFKRKKR